MDKDFETQIYDILVRSSKNVEATFMNLREACGMKKGKFLGYLLSKKGIGTNPEKIEAILASQNN